MSLDLADLAGLVIAVALHVYALTGGADFGAGVWDLLAGGPRKAAQRSAIHHAIAPIWEANHVWLILVVVLLFSAFPPAFAALTTALHVPLALMLGGIVLRGAAFVFHAYGMHPPERAQHWRRVFAAASAVTPVMLGATLGAASSGALRLDPKSSAPVAGYFSPWLQPFPLLLGLFVLALFTFLAAVYLCAEVEEPALRDDFRRRALGAGLVAGGLAWASLAAARHGAPRLFDALVAGRGGLAFQLLVAVTALGCLAALATRRWRLARALAIGVVSAVVWGWAVAQYPYIVAPDVDLHAAAAEPAVLRAVLLVLAAGSVVLAPAFVYLFRLFKSGDRAPRSKT